MRVLAVVWLNRPLPCCRSLAQGALTSVAASGSRSCPPPRFLALSLRRACHRRGRSPGVCVVSLPESGRRDRWSGASMSGQEHYRRAEELAAEAHRLLGQGDGQATAGVWAAVAETRAVLALAAATAVGASGADSRAWADAAGTGF